MSLPRSDERWAMGQAHPDILTIGHPLLKEHAERVTDFTAVPELCKEMTGLMRELNGVGLAAPQIGVGRCVIVIEVRATDLFPDRPASPLYQMVNPVLAWRSPHLEPGWEGCFSVPGLMGHLLRPTAVTVAFEHPDGREDSVKLEGIAARVAQHEIDHLQGMTFLQRTANDDLCTVANWRQFYGQGAGYAGGSEPRAEEI